jgi:uncharacterized protein YegP (UPF0339 family)
VKRSCLGPIARCRALNSGPKHVRPADPPQPTGSERKTTRSDASAAQKALAPCAHSGVTLTILRGSDRFGNYLRQRSARRFRLAQRAVHESLNRVPSQTMILPNTPKVARFLGARCRFMSHSGCARGVPFLPVPKQRGFRLSSGVVVAICKQMRLHRFCSSHSINEARDALHAGEWCWRLRAINGRIIADSGEGYKSYADYHGINLVASSAAIRIVNL